MRKAVFGKVLTLIISLLLASLALLLIYFFGEKIFSFVSETLFTGLKGFVCDLIGISKIPVIGRAFCAAG
ncbi:MAG: hypothetical protein HYW24_01465 [Candidatus Aenigmarchaeota archaeon]|nr:hypothetical protein [Candidatus Aenigmarchaeota archaeon]